MTIFNPKTLYFNQIIDHGDHLEKVSTNSNKLREEFTYLTTIPKELKTFYPEAFNFVDRGTKTSYRIVKIPTQDASQLLLSSDYDVEKIQNILDNVSDYLDRIPSVQSSLPEYQKSILRNIYVRNLTMVRETLALPVAKKLNDICQEFGYKDLNHYCDVLNQDLRTAFTKSKSKRLYYSHGDLRFANILPTSSKIYLIDPKGYVGDIMNTYRTLYHDIAQISSSILGHFDLINHEMFEINGRELRFSNSLNGHQKVEKKFHQMLKDFGLDLDLVRKLEASVFLSLIPLHQESEKKILGLLINSLKIFKGN